MNQTDSNIETISTHSFHPMIQIPDSVRTWIIPFTLMFFFFILPLQCFTIGDGLGLGVQGALYRYQITGYGISIIPINHEVGYVATGIYTGKTAVSVILWVAGSFILFSTLILSLICTKQVNHRILRSIIMGLGGSCILYLASLMAQYGLLFTGPAGISLPAGILIMAVFALFLYRCEDFLFSSNEEFLDC